MSRRNHVMLKIDHVSVELSPIPAQYLVCSQNTLVSMNPKYLEGRSLELL